MAVVAFGCNSILENEPGRLDRGGPAGQSSGTAGDDGSGATPISGDDDDSGSSGSSGTSGNGNAGGNGGSNSGGDDAGVPDATVACGVGQKSCTELCVSVDDPFYGCSAPACARCEVPNATAACVAGACGVGACAPGFADCNALPADGCEANLQTVTSCGGCGLVCPTDVKHADVACVNGACIGTCHPGFGDCNGDPQDGCEKNLLKDRNNCGACGTRCIFGRCDEGACVW